jgi:hypothetical protein
MGHAGEELLHLKEDFDEARKKERGAENKVDEGKLRGEYVRCQKIHN